MYKRYRGLYCTTTGVTNEYRNRPKLSCEKNNTTASSLYIDPDPRRLIRADTFRIMGIEVLSNNSWNRKIHRWRKVSVRVSLCGMLRLFRVDTLRRVHNVGFLEEHVISIVTILLLENVVFAALYHCYLFIYKFKEKWPNIRCTYLNAVVFSYHSTGTSEISQVRMVNYLKQVRS